MGADAFTEGVCGLGGAVKMKISVSGLVNFIAYPVGRSAWGSFLLGLIVIDVLFIGAHIATAVLAGFGIEPKWLMRFDITWEHSMAERFNYWKWFTCVILLAATAVKTRSRVFACMAGVFVFIFADDYYRMHERLGVMISERLEIGAMFGLRSNDFGELLVWAALGVPVLTLFAVAALSRSDRYWRHLPYFAICVAGLIGVGIGVDMIHSLMAGLFGAGPLDVALGVLEDGGELLIGSLVCSYALAALAGTEAFQRESVQERVTNASFVPGAGASHE